MCGRYALYGPVTRLRKTIDLAECPEFEPRYNIPPQTEVLIVRQRPGVGRVGQMVRWGLIPRWAKDAGIGAKLNNARAEGIAEKPSFRTSFARHRCLIPANGFYEWSPLTENGKVSKQPYHIRPDDDEGFFAFAGLLARWTSPEGKDIVSTCVITTTANEVMAPIHERMPVILGAGDFDAWLDPDNRSLQALEAVLKPAAAEIMVAYPVNSQVNRAGNEGPELILPIELDGSAIAAANRETPDS